MVITGNVIHAEKFVSKKDKSVYTKLFVPVHSGIAEVFAKGDLTALTGLCDVPFRLVARQDGLKLYYDGEEDEA